MIHIVYIPTIKQFTVLLDPMFVKAVFTRFAFTQRFNRFKLSQFLHIKNTLETIQLTHEHRSCYIYFELKIINWILYDKR